VPDPRRPHHLLRSIVGPVFAPIYGLGQHLASRKFSRDPRSITHFNAPVISVGNLTVGGTGKSPMIMRLARMLLDRDRRVIVAMRGYKSHRGHSDEAADLMASVQGVTVLAGANRIDQLQSHFKVHPIDPRTVILLDDGFQHRQIARELDLVLIDAAGPALHDRLLPWGDLREPVHALHRASAVILTHADQAGMDRTLALQSQIAARFPHLRLFTAQHTWASRSAFDLQSTALVPAALPADLETYFQHRRAVVVTAIGQPTRFIEQVRAQLGSQGHLEARLFPDHHPYSPADVERLITMLQQQASTEPPLLWTTSKDWVKLRPLLESAYRARSTLPPGTRVIIPYVSLTIEPLDTLTQLLDQALASRPAST
jgi:tetraacyldisaccharide 4'-kinase